MNNEKKKKKLTKQLTSDVKISRNNSCLSDSLTHACKLYLSIYEYEYLSIYLYRISVHTWFGACALMFLTLFCCQLSVSAGVC